MEEAAVVEEIAHSRWELRNRPLPINNLPNELLVRIFLEFRDVTEGPLWALRSRVGNTESFHMGWQGLMLVCRHWRDVLVSTPAFWRKVHVRMDGPTDWTERCLALSASASIDVYADPDLRREFSLDILYPHVHRFRSFRFDTVECPRLLATLPPLFGNGMPLLEDLYFIAHRLSTTKEDIDIQLTSQRFPRLRALSLSGMVSPQDVSLHAQLRTLSLSGCSHNLSFDRFLDVLAASAQLEELSLIAALHLFPDDWVRVAAVPLRAPISFPRLRELRLEEHGIVRTSLFLAHLHLHPSVALWIEGNFEESDYVDGSPDTVNSVSAMLPPDHIVTLPALSIATTVNMEVWGDVYEISCGTPRTETKKDIPNAILMLTTSGRRGWDCFMGQGLDDLVNAFGRSPLTRLNVEGDHRHATLDAWTRVFQTFPLLEVLDVRSGEPDVQSGEPDVQSGEPDVQSGEPDVSVETVFLGLHAASIATTQTDPGSSVACPNLKTVNVEGRETVETYEAMLDCFRYRAEKEVSALETLNLGFVLHPDDVPSDVRRGYIKDLRDVVGYVSRWVRSGSDLIFASESEDSGSETEGPESGSDGSESDGLGRDGSEGDGSGVA
ncbi:hypothetical protein LXA43DRAFT_198580 [Ganoderma leucocontextum]|nr:hypothetical protein LXA43DRAFT_198580 [Ganoderma leucocontextum]